MTLLPRPLVLFTVASVLSVAAMACDGLGQPLGTFAQATPDPTATPAPAPPPAPLYLPHLLKRADLARPKPRAWGMQFSLEDIPDLYDDYTAVELPRGRRAGLTAMRTNLRWDVVEPENTTPGGYDWTLYDARFAEYADAGYDILVTIVAYPEWATRYACGYALQPGMATEWRAFVRAAAERYADPRYKVAGWEIGNEVDGKTIVVDSDYERSPDWGGGQPTTPYGGCWGDRAAEYVEFLRIAHEEIKAVDPDAPVTLGGLANVDLSPMLGYPLFHMDFLDRFLEAGGGDYIDFFTYHWFPDVDPRYQPPGPEKHRRLMASLRRYGLEVPVWLTETYRLTMPTDPSSEYRQVRFVTSELVEMLAFPEIERVYWYGWVDFPTALKADPDAPDRGAVRADHSPRPVVRVLPHAIEHTNGVPEDISTESVRAYRFTWPRTDRSYIVAWSLTGGSAPLTLPARPGESAEATYFPADMLLAGRCCGEATVPEDGGWITLDVGADPVLVAVPAP